MPKNKRALKAALAVALAVPALLWVAWFVAVPSGMIEERALGAISTYGGINASFDNFRKGFFFSVKADAITIKFDRGTIKATELSASLRPGALLKGRVEVTLDAKLGGGPVMATYSRPITTYKGESFDLRGRKIALAEFLPIAYTGVSGTGTGELDMELSDGAGEMRLSVAKLEIAPFSVGPYTFPADRLREGRALVKAAPGSLEIVSANIEGDGIFVRLKGKAASGRFDGALEIMPSAELETEPYFIFIQQYKRGTGQYTIPLANTLQ